MQQTGMRPGTEVEKIESNDLSRSLLVEVLVEDQGKGFKMMRIFVVTMMVISLKTIVQ